MIARCLALALALACVAVAPATTVDWTLGEAVDCALPAALPSQAMTRTIVLPGGAVTEVPSFWNDDQLFVKAIRNTLIVQLRDPLFVATMQAYDDQGNLYLINLRAAKPGEAVDEILVLRQKPDATLSGGALASDSDGAISDMMAAMVGGVGHPSIAGSLVTRVEDGAMVPGRRIFADDTLSLELVKVFQGPSVRGYECVARYVGDQTVRLDMQRLWFPGALAVYASSQILLSPDDAGVEIQPNQAIKLYYVAE